MDLSQQPNHQSKCWYYMFVGLYVDVLEIYVSHLNFIFFRVRKRASESVILSSQTRPCQSDIKNILVGLHGAVHAPLIRK